MCVRTLVCAPLPKSDIKFQKTWSSIVCVFTVCKSYEKKWRASWWSSLQKHVCKLLLRRQVCLRLHSFSNRGVSTIALSVWRSLWSSSRCPRLPRAWPPPVSAHWPPWSGRPSSAARPPLPLPDCTRANSVSPGRRHHKLFKMLGLIGHLPFRRLFWHRWVSLREDCRSPRLYWSPSRPALCLAWWSYTEVGW